MTGPELYCGIDVGTGSARAGIFDRTGTMIGAASAAIETWRGAHGVVEQSSDNIWAMCGQAVRAALTQAGCDPAQVRGAGFDATCSLVALDARDKPVSVSHDGDDRRNVVVWMDHRAVEQARRINEGEYDVLRYVGGTISPEMQSPKLLWLKEELPRCWERSARFLDLPDFLTYRATGSDVRSLCSTVCKWTYLGHEAPADDVSVGRWDVGYWRAIGLGDIVDEEFVRIGTRVRPMGEAVGSGLTGRAAAELGLPPGTAVGVSIIDAHAGGLGVIGAALDGGAPTPADMDRRLALIGGTSSCHMAVSREPRFIPGIWGPYKSAMIPGMWLTEGGQSATGALIDHVIQSHAAATEVRAKADAENTTVYEVLNAVLASLSQGADFPALLTERLHVLPYHHGNRSPRANPGLRGHVSGLRLDPSIEDLALQYLAAIQAIAYGTRHIIEEMNRNGYAIDTIFACGGGTKNPVFLREHADCTGCRVVLPKEPEAVLLGSAILGAVASGDFESILDGMATMNQAARIIEPSRGAVARYHEKKYRIFHRMYDDFLAYEEIMRA